MATLISFLTTLASLALAWQVGRQWLARLHPHQLVWAFALSLFSLGAACQFIAEAWGWSPLIYRLWYISGALLSAAYLGQGSLYLLASRRAAHISMGILAPASLVAAWLVLRAPLDLNLALAGGFISGKGMPHSIRLLTPFFNIFGTLALVGSALRSSWFFLWSGGSTRRALGTGLIAFGALIVAAGGTLARFSVPGALYLTELIGVVLIFSGFQLTALPLNVPPLTRSQLTRRRLRVSRIGVGLLATAILGSIAALPVMPWTMGIVRSVQHVYISQVPQENRGAYLVTTQGVMQLYTWNVEPADFPVDAPTLDRNGLESIAVVQKQFDLPENYHLYALDRDELVPWIASHAQGMQLNLQFAPLQPGDYVLEVPADSMFGGKTYHYFHLK